VSGEELYWLAKLCEQNHEKALLAAERYIAGGELAHGPDARLLLATLQMRTTGGWEAAWGTIVTILQKDPIEPVQAQIDVESIMKQIRIRPKRLNGRRRATRFCLVVATVMTLTCGVHPLVASFTPAPISYTDTIWPEREDRQ
jgi:hypothetical protein